MVYVIAWDESEPDGSEAASTIDTEIRNLKESIRERLEDILPTWATDGTDPKMLALYKAGVHLASPVAISDNTATAVIWDTETFDVGAMFTIGSPTRITITRTGYYLAVATVEFAADVDGYRRIYLRKNAGVEEGGTDSHANSASIETRLSTSKIFSLTAADYLEVVVHHTAGNALNIGALQTNFQVTQLA